MKKTKFKSLLFFALLFFVTTSSSYAESGSDPIQPADGDGPDGPPAAPINSALPILAILGAALAYKVYDKSTKKVY